MNNEYSALPSAVLNAAQSWLLTLGETDTPRIEPLAGDGSARRFFRMRTPQRNAVLLYDPGWDLSKDYAAHQQYLARAGVPVPRFHQESPGQGILIMEDLGDELLQHRLLQDPGAKESWLERLIALLAHLHGSTYPVPRELPAAGRRFDQEKYSQELLFTWEHLAQGYLHLGAPGAPYRRRLQDFCGALERISPEVFCHRDFHTRNVLIHGERLFLIDFQDARLGAPHYDLASLLFDPYIPVAPDLRERLQGRYLAELESFPVAGKLSRETFTADLEAVAFQRLVKAAGSFASFFTRFGKSTHLCYLLPALRSAQNLQTRSSGWLADYADLFPLDSWIEMAQAMESDTL